jgi:hypothetical protein
MNGKEEAPKMENPDENQGKSISASMNSPSSTFATMFSPKNKLSFNGFQKKEVGRCLVCGGKDCPKCGLNAYKKLEKPALYNLHSHWITDYIVAMQRPNNTVLEGGALDDMKKKKISAVFNLTQPGEHPFCGPGLIHETGFPFDPELLMKAGSKSLVFFPSSCHFIFSFFFSFLVQLNILISTGKT